MTFNVSNAFKLDETTRHHWVNCYFQFELPENVKQPINQARNKPAFNVSDVSYLNRLFENVFGACQRECKIMIDGRQVSTKLSCYWRSLQKYYWQRAALLDMTGSRWSYYA
jgi:hypothetical protein|tara:strand:- start:86 stop:418 length:333 start_codon:yes stop_codon:yes gene_type:complete